jgi:hypothetical protein
MLLFQLFRSFQPLGNPVGFGAADCIELAVAALLALLVLGCGWIERVGSRIAERTGWCLLLTGAAPLALRLGLLARRGVPTPGGADDFSYLLLADTLRHWRLANPVHPMHRFFETIFVLQEPSYASIFPLGQGVALAVFGHPWAGVALSVAIFCAACYWMLRGWTTPGWALVGGLLAGMEFGPLNQWMNTYWGGAVSATAGCLVFGALPRLREYGRTRDAVWLGAGLGLELLTRPFESVLLGLCVLLYFVKWRWLGIAALAAAPAVGLTLAQNRAVTGKWMTLPYQVSRYQYGVPAAFTTQENAVPHRELTRQQQLDYEIQSAVHGVGRDTVVKFFERLGYRMRFYRFFFLAPLYLAFLWRLGEVTFAWIVCSGRKGRLETGQQDAILPHCSLAVVVFAVGTNFYPYFYPHYIAAVACLFILVSVRVIERVNRQVALVVMTFCAAHFLFWYGAHLFGVDEVTRYESWDYVNVGDPEGRAEIDRQLAREPGKLLVFVRYSPRHVFHEWVHNAADIDGARVVWAGDLGLAENEALRRYYPDRTVWLVEPDARPPQLSRYEGEAIVEPPAVKKDPPKKGPVLQFEEIPKAK